MRRLAALIVIGVSYYTVGFSQTGPGGVGNAGGSGGQPKNVIWLKGGSGVSQTGGLVDSWTDQSGNLFSAAGTGSTRPTYVASDGNFNGQAVVDFANTGTNKHLSIADNDALDNTTGLTLYAVFRSTDISGDKALLSKRTGAGVDQSYMMWINSGDLFSRIGSDNTSPNVNTIAANTTNIAGVIYNGSLSNPRTFNYLNGSFVLSGNGPTSISNTSSNLYLGAFDVSPGETRNLAGRMSEVLVFTTALNAAQRQLVENYLAAKYAVTIGNDVYAGDVHSNNYDFDVIGIGRASSTTHTEASAAGLLLSTYNGSVDTDGEFVMAGHSGVANAVSLTQLGTSVQQRWERTWYIDKTGTLDAAITFDFGDGIGGLYPQDKDDYELLRFDGSAYQVVTIASSDKEIVGDRITFNVADASLTDGIYTLGTTNSTDSPVDGEANRTWYSYQTGNWENATSWTLDGGVTPLYVNPSNETPGSIDNVVITSGRTITMTANTHGGSNLEVNGTLDLAATSGHSFVSIAGTGRIRMSGASGNDNFPSGSTTGFANATTGGTLEVYGTGIALNQSRTLNDVIINLTSGIASLTASTLTLNGDLQVSQGTFRFGNGSSAASTLTVYGDVTVETGTTMSVATNNVRHQFNMYGDLTNDGGTVQFTNRASAVYTSEATDGIVDANFLSSNSDQNIVCNGVTRFYRIKIDKGTDDTYLASFSANAANQFLLFGYSNDDDPSSSQLTTSNNSFTLLRGTAEIKTNVSLPVLSNAGNFNISAGAMLWVNGGTVLKNNGNSTVPYGKLKVTSGLFESKVNAGITTRDNGTIIIEGGTVNTNQIRTSVLGASNVGGYVQTGGAVTVDGGFPGGSGLDYYVFSLTYTGNVFQMSGGTLTVKGARAGTSSTRGAIFINSDPANVSVTGGTIIAEISNANPYVITSRAQFWNLILRNTFDTSLREVDLLGGTSGPSGGGASEITLAAQALVVKGGLTIESYAELDHNAKNVSIEGNFTIQANGSYRFNATNRRNTTTFNGSDDAVLTFLNRTGGTGDEQRFWNLVINKPSGKKVSLASGKTDLSGTNNNLLRIDGTSFKLLSGTLDQGFHSVRLYCDSVVNYQTLGVYSGATTALGTVSNDGNDLIKLRDDNAPTKFLTTSSSLFGAVRLNSGDDPIELVSDVRMQMLEYQYGKIDLGEYRLTVDKLIGRFSNFAAVPPGTNNADSLGLDNRKFSVEDMFATDGNNSDGGLKLYIPAGTANGTQFIFPVGIGTTADDNANTPGTDKYTPAYVTISGVVDDGYITINPVNTALDLLNGAPADMLQYYWNVRYSDFTTVPTAKLRFTYNDADDNVGTVTNFVPGRVVGFSTREADALGTAGVVEAVKQIDFTTGTLTAGLYTAAAPAAFTGTIQVFYNRENGETSWNDDNKWSLIGHNGTATTDQPGPGDVVRLRNEDASASNNSWVTMDVSTSVAAVVFDGSGGGWLPRITIDNDETVSLGIVEGPGEIMVEMNAGLSPVINDTDFGDFASQTSSVFIYKVQDNATYDAYTSFTEYPSLRVEGNGGTVGNRILRNTIPLQINRDLRIDFGGSFRAEADVTISRDLHLSGGGSDGGFEFGENAAHTVTVGERVRFLAGADNRVIVRNTTPSTLVHTLSVGGNIEKADGTFDLYNGTGTNNNAILEFSGTANATFTNTGGSTPDLFRLVMNKGSNITSTFTLSDAIVLNGVTNTAAKAIELQHGLLIVNESTQAFTLSSGGGDFSIPSGAGLEVRSGTVDLTGSDTGLLLDGYLLVSGGTVNIDDAVGNGNNFIEYSASGSAILQITAGTLTVGSQIRRNLTSTAGILKYRQSGGTVVVGRRAAPTTSRGVFEVVNAGSEFTHTAGTLTLVRGINSSTVPSLLLEPETPTTFTTSNITIGSANTPAGVNGQNIGIKADGYQLGNLTIDNSSGNAPRALIYSAALDISGTFTINSGASFNAQGFNLTLRGNSVIDGTFVPSNNTVVLAPSAARTISGTGAISFYNLTKDNSNANGISLLSSIEVTNDLRIQRGNIEDNGNTITLRGNCYMGVAPSTTGTHSSNAAGQGLVFAGATQQQLFALRTDGTASFGTVTINNANGVVVSDQSDKFTIDTELRLQNGVLDIGGSLLSLAATAEIEQVNLFSVSNMIQTNSSFTDNGILKNFAANRTTDFIFPVGQLLYTPVYFNFSDAGHTTGASASSITVRPANERQPIIVDDVESGACTTSINDLNNTLQYHWIITAASVASSFEADMTLTYDQSLVADDNGPFETDFLAARVLAFNSSVGKFPGDVNATTNELVFRFSGVNESGISGEYFAGEDCAIPNTVPVYTTLGGGAGTGSVNTLSIYSGAPSLPPAGAILVVSAGDVVTVDVNSLSMYRTEIYGTLRIESGTLGNRLGTVSGTGVLRLEVNAPDVGVVLPAGYYNQFFSCSGGGLELGGDTSYEILGGITSLRSLTVDGTGSRNLANNDLTICEDFVVNGATFTNPNNRNIFVGRDLAISSGSFSSGAGNTLEIDRDLIINGGSFSGQTSGTKIVNGDLTVSSGTFTAGSGGTLTLAGDLTYSGGTFSGGTGTHKTVFQGTASQATTGAITLNRLEINNSLGITLGGSTSVSNELLLTNGIITASSTVALAQTSTVTPTGGKSTSFVSGRVSKVMPQGASFNFPIGKSTRWRPAAVINPTSATLTTWEFEYYALAPTTDPLVNNITPSSTSIKTVSNGEYWKVSTGATSNTATIGLSWGIDSDVSSNVVEQEDLVVMLWNDVTSLWDSRGGTNFSVGHSQSHGTFNSSSTISFSEQIVTLGSTDAANPLPVTLVRFDGEVVGQAASLSWQTATELDNDYFEVQHSADGKEYVSIGVVKGNGTTTKKHNYSFVHDEMVLGRNYYRLKQVDFSGEAFFSNVISLTLQEFGRLGVVVYPNPTTPSNVNLLISGNGAPSVQVRLLDLQGREVQRYELPRQQFGSTTMPLSDEIRAGVYLLEVVGGFERVITRVVIVK